MTNKPDTLPEGRGDLSASVGRLEELAKGLSRAQRAMMVARHTDDGNPWPFIGMTQRTGGAKNRTFQKLRAVELYDRGNCLTPLGEQLRQSLLNQEKPK